MSEKIQGLLASLLARVISTKAFWTALGCILLICARGVWYASATYSEVKKCAEGLEAFHVSMRVFQGEMKQLREAQIELEKRVIRLEVKAGIAAKKEEQITTTASIHDL